VTTASLFPTFQAASPPASIFDDARRMAEEALALHLAGMAEDDEPIREPSSLEAVMADRENRDAVAILVRAPRGDDQSSSGQHDDPRGRVGGNRQILRRARLHPVRIPGARGQKGDLRGDGSADQRAPSDP
jgi:predicted RNase H-like HicB family nuclease